MRIESLSGDDFSLDSVRKKSISHYFSTFLLGVNHDVSASPQHLNFAKISSAKAEDSYSLDEEEIAEMIIEDRNLGRDVSGHVVFTTSCHLIAPCVVAPGSLTVTSEALFFAVDEENPEYQKLDPKVRVFFFKTLTAI